MHERVNISSKCTPVFTCSKLTVGVLSTLGGCQIYGLTKNLLAMKTGLPIEKGLEVLSILTFKLSFSVALLS